ncbi:hypothetical protein CDD83_7556 [Cordyceps sp. RAO-2017]|nr:hypothetical protein CDD83_7556 [Cordyceps sp. RAO-2017]
MSNVPTLYKTLRLVLARKYATRTSGMSRNPSLSARQFAAPTCQRRSVDFGAARPRARPGPIPTRAHVPGQRQPTPAEMKTRNSRNPHSHPPPSLPPLVSSSLVVSPFFQNSSPVLHTDAPGVDGPIRSNGLVPRRLDLVWSQLESPSVLRARIDGRSSAAS